MHQKVRLLSLDLVKIAQVQRFALVNHVLPHRLQVSAEVRNNRPLYRLLIRPSLHRLRALLKLLLGPGECHHIGIVWLLGRSPKADVFHYCRNYIALHNILASYEFLGHSITGIHFPLGARLIRRTGFV